MGDTTTLFILELYEILQHTADIAFVKKMWPSAKNALEWCMGNANKNGYECDNSVSPISSTVSSFIFVSSKLETPLIGCSAH